MPTTRTSSFLSRVLLADALSCAAAAIILLSAGGALSGLFGLPPMLLMGAGAALLAFALGVAWVATRHPIPRKGVWTVIIVNAIWALDSILLLLSGRVEPTLLGQGFVLIQALVAAVFAELQYTGLRRPGNLVAA